MRENAHQMLAARKRRKELGVPLEAGLSGVQVAEREDLTPEQLVDRLVAIAPKTIKGRSRTPRPMRAAKIAIDAPVVEKWTLGYLIDLIYLRDAWMHRVDTARATSKDLELTGPAGGSFTSGTGGDALVFDAVEFCCLLAGRGEPTGLLRTIVPF